MKYKYKNYVTIEEIIGNDSYRYLLTARLDDGLPEKIALIIMKNPSKATKDISDQTVNRVLEIMHNFKYSKVYITNLIPVYSTYPSAIADNISANTEIYENNDIIIREKAIEAYKIFVGWGGSNGIDYNFYIRRIQSIKNCIGNKKTFCYRIIKCGMPVHPSRNQWKTIKPEKEYEEYHLKQKEVN